MPNRRRKLQGLVGRKIASKLSLVPDALRFFQGSSATTTTAAPTVLVAVKRYTHHLLTKLGLDLTSRLYLRFHKRQSLRNILKARYSLTMPQFTLSYSLIVDN